MEECRKDKLVFCVTAGRTGTLFLAELLDTLDDVEAFHEAEPSFNSFVRLVNQRRDVAIEFWRKIKLPAIAKTSAPFYVETSNMFAKGFLEALLALGVRPGLIFLDRLPQEIALSHYRIGAIPGMTVPATFSLLTPGDPGVLPLPGWERDPPFALCFWYALELERRHFLYEDMAQTLGLPYFRVKTKELQDYQVFSQLCATFDLPYPCEVRHRALCDVHHNPKARRYADPEPDVRERIEEMVWKRVSLFDPALHAKVAAKWSNAIVAPAIPGWQAPD